MILLSIILFIIIGLGFMWLGADMAHKKANGSFLFGVVKYDFSKPTKYFLFIGKDKTTDNTK